MVGLWSEVAKRMISRLGRFSHGGTEPYAIQAVKAITLNYGGVDMLAAKNVFKGTFGGGGAGARGAGHGNHWILAGHSKVLPIRNIKFILTKF